MDIDSNRTRAGYLAAAAVAVMIAGCGIAATDFEYVYLPGTERESGANLDMPPFRVRALCDFSGLPGPRGPAR